MYVIARTGLRITIFQVSFTGYPNPPCAFSEEFLLYPIFSGEPYQFFFHFECWKIACLKLDQKLDLSSDF